MSNSSGCLRRYIQQGLAQKVCACLLNCYYKDEKRDAAGMLQKCLILIKWYSIYLCQLEVTVGTCYLMGGYICIPMHMYTHGPHAVSLVNLKPLQMTGRNEAKNSNLNSRKWDLLPIYFFQKFEFSNACRVCCELISFTLENV